MEFWKILSSRLVKNKNAKAIRPNRDSIVSFVTDSEKQGTGISIPLQSSAEEFHSKICEQLSTEKRKRLLKAISSYAKTSNIKHFIKQLDALVETNTDLLDVIRNVVFDQHKAIYDNLKARKLFYARNEKHLVQIKKGIDDAMGFKIRGGKEYGVGFYVTSVKLNSPADIAGLKPGDKVYRINNLRIQESIKDELVEIFRSKDSMSLVVKSCGVYPIKKDGKTEWISVNESFSKEIKDAIDRIITIAIGAQGFGCKIRRLNEYEGVYVVSIKDGSLAQKVGLKIGDKVLNINGRDFLNINHQEAFDIIKSARNISMVVSFNKDVREHLRKKESKNDERNILRSLKESEDTKKAEASYVASYLHAEESFPKNSQEKSIESGNKDKYEYQTKVEETETKIEPGEIEINKKSSSNEREKYDKIYSGSNNINVTVIQESENKKLNEKTKMSRESNQPNTTSILRSSNTSTTKKTGKHPIFAESVNVEIIEVEKIEDEDKDDEVILPDSSNFNYSKDFLNGREVHYVSIPKGNPMGMELTQKGNIVAVKSVSANGAVGTHGFIQPGDWLLNAEGDDLIGKDVMEANKLISGILQRWSKHIEFIVACSPGRKPPKLPTKKDSSEPFREASVLYATVSKEQTSSDDSSLEISSCSELSMDYILPKIEKIKRDKRKTQSSEESQANDKILNENTELFEEGKIKHEEEISLPVNNIENTNHTPNKQLFSKNNEMLDSEKPSQFSEIQLSPNKLLQQQEDKISPEKKSTRKRSSSAKKKFPIKNPKTKNEKVTNKDVIFNNESLSINNIAENVIEDVIIGVNRNQIVSSDRNVPQDNATTNIAHLSETNSSVLKNVSEILENKDSFVVLRNKKESSVQSQLFHKENIDVPVNLTDSIKNTNFSIESKKFPIKNPKTKNEKVTNKDVIFNNESSSINNIAENVIEDVIIGVNRNQIVSSDRNVPQDNATANIIHLSETNSSVLKNVSEILENKDSFVVLRNKKESSVQSQVFHKKNIDVPVNLTDSIKNTSFSIESKKSFQVKNTHSPIKDSPALKTIREISEYEDSLVEFRNIKLSSVQNQVFQKDQIDGLQSSTESIQSTDSSIKNTPDQPKNIESLLKKTNYPIEDTDTVIKITDVPIKKVESPFFTFEKQVIPIEKISYHTSKTDLSGSSQIKLLNEKNSLPIVKQKVFSEVGVQTEVEHPSVHANEDSNALSNSSVLSSSSVLVENKVISHKYTLYSYNKNEEEKIKNMRKTNLHNLEKDVNFIPLNDVLHESEEKASVDFTSQKLCPNCFTYKTIDNKADHATNSVIPPFEQKVISLSTPSSSDKNLTFSSTSSITYVSSRSSTPIDSTPLVFITTPKYSPRTPRTYDKFKITNNNSEEISNKKSKTNLGNKHIFDSYGSKGSHLNFLSLTKYSPRIPERDDFSILVSNNNLNDSNFLMEMIEKKIQPEKEVLKIKNSAEQNKSDSFNESNVYGNNELIIFPENKQSVQPLLITNTFTKMTGIFSTSKNSANKMSKSKMETEKIEEQLNFNQNILEDKSYDGFNGKGSKAFSGNKADILSFLNTKVDVLKNDAYIKTFSVAEINKNFRKENILDVKEPLYIDEKKTETMVKKEKTVYFDSVNPETKKDLLFVAPSSNFINKSNKKDLKIHSGDSIGEITLSSYSKTTLENQHSIIFTKSVLMQPSADNYLKQKDEKHNSNNKRSDLNLKKNNDVAQLSNQSVSIVEQNGVKTSKNVLVVENQKKTLETQTNIFDVELDKPSKNDVGLGFQSNRVEFSENLGHNKFSNDVSALIRSNSFPLNSKSSHQQSVNDSRERSHSIVSSRKEIKSILQKYNKKTLSKKVKFSELVTVGVTTPPNSEFSSEEENNTK